MNNKILLSLLAVLSMSLCSIAIYDHSCKPVVRYDLTQNDVENMPIIANDPYHHVASGGIPEEQRDSRFIKWLSAGVRINANNSSGSGTIVYYDPQTNTAYVQSCGHLWRNNIPADHSGKIECDITTWYHNSEKLSKPKTYRAEVLYANNNTGLDCSLLKFQPDWQPEYFPIAPEDYVFEMNSRLHSVGCDGGKEVAHYDVRVVGWSGSLPNDKHMNLVTTENSPRPGRSGGGLMTDEYFVGVCWGTSKKSGEGNGYFTPLSTVIELNKLNGFGWLNEIGDNLARRIPIIDKNNPQGKYPRDYIPLPKN